MAIKDMYQAKPGSPKTLLTSQITADATSMTVEDASVLPDAPNICVIGEDENAEVVYYATKNGNTISGLLRGLALSDTSPRPWIVGTAVARYFTSFDHNRFIENIEDLQTNKSDVSHTHDDRYYTETEIDNLLTSKAPLASPQFTGTPSGPTANVSTNNSQLATTEYVHKRGCYHATGNISQGTTVTFLSSNITETMEVKNVVFGIRNNVTSDVSWTTTSGSVTFTGTFAGATVINFDLEETDIITLS